MSNRKQIGYSLSVWETLKEYNEETKWFEPIKNKKVEVAQMLSEEMSDNEEMKNILIDKLFEYKDDIKRLLKNGEYSDIPSYHKESLEKDQKIADLEAKLAEFREQITILDEENSKTFMKSVNAWRENAELKQQLDEKENELTILKLDYEFVSKEYDKLVDIGVFKFKQHEQDKISFAVEQLEKAKEWVKKRFEEISCIYEEDVTEYIDNQIEELKKEMK